MSDRNETNEFWRQVHAEARASRNERALRDDDRIRQWEAEGKLGAFSVDLNGCCWRLWNPKNEANWLDIWLTTGTIMWRRTREKKVGLAHALRLLDISIAGYNHFAEKKKR